jgi:hypothetical protein
MEQAPSALINPPTDKLDPIVVFMLTWIFVPTYALSVTDKLYWDSVSRTTIDPASIDALTVRRSTQPLPPIIQVSETDNLSIESKEDGPLT